MRWKSYKNERVVLLETIAKKIMLITDVRHSIFLSRVVVVRSNCYTQSVQRFRRKVHQEQLQHVQRTSSCVYGPFPCSSFGDGHDLQPWISCAYGHVQSSLTSFGVYLVQQICSSFSFCREILQTSSFAYGCNNFLIYDYVLRWPSSFVSYHEIQHWTSSYVFGHDPIRQHWHWGQLHYLHHKAHPLALLLEYSTLLFE